MMKIISQSETNYKLRGIAPVIRDMADVLPVMVITGARQVGKSTMPKNEFTDYAYLTLDDYAILEQARLDPQSLWVDKDKIIIDEAQRLPQLFLAIKLAVNMSNRRKHFILSGPANLYLMEKVTESLAGRKAYRESGSRAFHQPRLAHADHGDRVLQADQGNAQGKGVRISFQMTEGESETDSHFTIYQFFREM
jgi:hypothetical protein